MGASEVDPQINPTIFSQNAGILSIPEAILLKLFGLKTIEPLI
jgi:hypothetical protein